MPNDRLEAEMLLNYGSLVAYQATPSILGQLVWSFVQYFPLFLAFYWLADLIFGFLLREKILKRKVAHDSDYLKLVDQENQRRSKLALR
jgi:hypothetical protein